MEKNNELIKRKLNEIDWKSVFDKKYNHVINDFKNCEKNILNSKTSNPTERACQRKFIKIEIALPNWIHNTLNVSYYDDSIGKYTDSLLVSIALLELFDKIKEEIPTNYKIE